MNDTSNTFFPDARGLIEPAKEQPSDIPEKLPSAMIFKLTGAPKKSVSDQVPATLARRGAVE
jgi:hypothetical protein